MLDELFSAPPAAQPIDRHVIADGFRTETGRPETTLMFGRSLRVIVAAAGKGTRYLGDTPKVVAAGGQPVPLVVRVVSAVLPLDAQPLIVVNETTGPLVEKALREAGLEFATTVQDPAVPGMGGAVLSALRSFEEPPDDVLVVWADMGMVWAPNLWLSVVLHQHLHSWMSFPTKTRKDPYVSTIRDSRGQPCDFLFRRHGDPMPPTGESDCGAFVFRADILRELLECRAGAVREPGQEIDILPLVRDLAAAGRPRYAFHMASDEESQGVNTLAELEKADLRYESGLNRTRNAFAAATDAAGLLEVVTQHSVQPPLVKDFCQHMARTGLKLSDLPVGLRSLCS
ncbi:NTP transferase domain-containing protein [Streptomyces pactum]|uniref:NTP transferase domain-containing protein n=1 Tax=Streptomyces pactum TaxID=68249 RepID=A0ABS0NL27_9ACTN|nr:NTP transferase domain-containing protein [Streptomyces pactum]